MAENLRITSIRVPADLVRNCPGFALDIGSSALKIVYRTKEAWDYIQEHKTASHGTLHCISTSRSNVQPALDVVKENGHLSRDDQGKAHVITCGWGGYENNDQIIDTLDVTVKMVFEGQPMVEAFRYLLEQCSTADIVYPFLKDVEQAAFTEVQTRWASMKHLGVSDPNENLFKHQENFPLVDDRSLLQIVGEDKLYPCLMYIMGSGFGSLQVTHDGIKSVPSDSGTGGRLCLGVASLLTGCKSYDEFMDLAEKGDSKKVDMTCQGLKSFVTTSSPPTIGIQDDNPYKMFLEANAEDDEMVFSFGQAMFKNAGEFKKEDIAAAWLLNQVSSVSFAMYSTARKAGIRYVFVGGSFPNRDIVRKLVTREFTKCRLRWEKQQTDEETAVIPELHFLKNSGFLAALGAMIEAAKKSDTKA